jgi:hypothetical protein
MATRKQTKAKLNLLGIGVGIPTRAYAIMLAWNWLAPMYTTVQLTFAQGIFIVLLASFLSVKISDFHDGGEHLVDIDDHAVFVMRWCLVSPLVLIGLAYLLKCIMIGI